MQRYKASSAARTATKLLADGSSSECFSKARIHYHIVCGEERLRDPDNWLARCKPITDGLRDAHIIKSDDWRCVSYKVSFEIDKARAPLTIITVTEDKDA